MQKTSLWVIKTEQSANTAMDISMQNMIDWDYNAKHSTTTHQTHQEKIYQLKPLEKLIFGNVFQPLSNTLQPTQKGG